MLLRNLLALLLFVVSMLSAQAGAAIQLDKIKMPPGFSIELYTANVPGARQMCLSPAGTLFIGTREPHGRVYAVPDKNHDGKADEVLTIIQDMRIPNGVAFRKGSLYVAQIPRILRYDDIEANLMHLPPPVVVTDKYPSDEHHGWKYIKFGPDDMLYVPVGAPCNVCVRDENKYACLTRMKPDGTGMETIAHGIRNTVGFAWHPKSKELWFTDNGRDWLGDNLPPDELNHAPQVGLHFGFPYRYGNNVPDPEFGNRKPDGVFTAPAQCLDPHVAALGMVFYTGKQFPKDYTSKVFIAEHGSWNRSAPLGYRVMSVTIDGDKASDYKIFAEGWLQNGKPWGRPVDVLVMPDGALLVSDDLAGVVYRISYKNEPSKQAESRQKSK